MSEEGGTKRGWRKLADARSCGVAGHVKESEFYFKCNGKPLKNLSMERTLIKLALKKKSLRLSEELQVPLAIQIQHEFR